MEVFVTYLIDEIVGKLISVVPLSDTIMINNVSTPVEAKLVIILAAETETAESVRGYVYFTAEELRSQNIKTVKAFRMLPHLAMQLQATNMMDLPGLGYVPNMASLEAAFAIRQQEETLSMSEWEIIYRFYVESGGHYRHTLSSLNGETGHVPARNAVFNLFLFIIPFFSLPAFRFAFEEYIRLDGDGLRSSVVDTSKRAVRAQFSFLLENYFVQFFDEVPQSAGLVQPDGTISVQQYSYKVSHSCVVLAERIMVAHREQTNPRLTKSHIGLQAVVHSMAMMKTGFEQQFKDLISKRAGALAKILKDPLLMQEAQSLFHTRSLCDASRYVDFYPGLKRIIATTVMSNGSDPICAHMTKMLYHQQMGSFAVMVWFCTEAKLTKAHLNKHILKQIIDFKIAFQKIVNECGKYWPLYKMLSVGTLAESTKWKKAVELAFVFHMAYLDAGSAQSMLNFRLSGLPSEALIADLKISLKDHYMLDQTSDLAAIKSLCEANRTILTGLKLNVQSILDANDIDDFYENFSSDESALVAAAYQRIKEHRNERLAEANRARANNI